jgi:hypothetical protein
VRRIEVTASTMGQANPSAAGEGRFYHYQRDPTWTPNDPRYREEAARTHGAAVVSAERSARIAEFASYRAEGLSITAAGQRLGIAPKTARTYERERKAAGGSATP